MRVLRRVYLSVLAVLIIEKASKWLGEFNNVMYYFGSRGLLKQFPNGLLVDNQGTNSNDEIKQASGQRDYEVGVPVLKVICQDVHSFAKAAKIIQEKKKFLSSLGF